MRRVRIKVARVEVLINGEIKRLGTLEGRFKMRLLFDKFKDFIKYIKSFINL